MKTHYGCFRGCIAISLSNVLENVSKSVSDRTDTVRRSFWMPTTWDEQIGFNCKGQIVKLTVETINRVP